MRLYYAPNTISVAVAITLHEAGIDFEPVRLNFRGAEQTKPEYLAVNPKGRVPTLETGPARLTETGAIIEYIAAIAPDAKLVPDDPLQAAHMRGVMYYLASTMHVNHAHGVRGTRWADKRDSHDDMRTKTPKTMTESASYVERHCLRGDLVLGAQFSLADPYLFVVCNWLEGDGVPLDGFPAIAAHMTGMRNRPSVKAVISQGMLTQ